MMSVAGRDYEAGKTEFLKQAAAAYDRMMKEELEQAITFDQMEDRALEVGSKLECFLMERRLADVAQQRNDAAACCPQCNKPLRVTATHKTRQIRGRTGKVCYERQEGYCPACRRAFFPSGSSVAAWR
jgi:uncharacterized protein YbaR (Trm112 family)